MKLPARMGHPADSFGGFGEAGAVGAGFGVEVGVGRTVLIWRGERSERGAGVSARRARTTRIAARAMARKRAK
jgi:hypothetical protein